MKMTHAALLLLCLMAWTASAEAGEITGKIQIPGRSNLENLIVYVEGVTGGFSPPKKQPEMNHIDLRFAPGTLAVLKGTTVSFPNADTVFHSAFSISKSNPFELGIYGPGREKAWTFANPGLVEIFCHIHSHMFGYLLVLDNPFFAMTSKDGSFTIQDVPDGAYTLKAWVSPSASQAQPITIKGGESKRVNFAFPSAK